jgi:undecaprenyl diphosphate synthase
MTINDISKNNIPQHIAIIMDGNGRWAKKSGMQRVFGHQNGVAAVRAATSTAAELGVRFLTLYAFSTENCQRPQSEIDTLMKLLADAIENELPDLQKNNVRLMAIGNLALLPASVRQKFENATLATAANTGLTLVVALAYSGRWEITDAVRRMCADAVQQKLDPAAINEVTVAEYLQTSFMPDPDLFIRTGGDLRISNFLLWQIAYTELYFAQVLWPDFRKEHFLEIIAEYQRRERRFGRV